VPYLQKSNNTTSLKNNSSVNSFFTVIYSYESHLEKVPVSGIANEQYFEIFFLTIEGTK